MNVPKFAGAVPSDTEVLTLVRNSSLLTTAVAEKAARTLARRRELTEAIAAAERGAAKAFAAREKRVNDSFLAVQVAERATATAKAELRLAIAERSTGSFAHSDIVDSASAELRATAAPEIGLFIAEMRDELATARRLVRARELETRNPVTGKTVRTIDTNSVSVVARLEAIRDAIEAAEAMRLDPDQTDIATKLQKLRAALPAVSN